MSKRNADHVRLGGVDGNHVFSCQHCGDKYGMSSPAPLSVLAAAGAAFLKDHRTCRKPAEAKADK